VHVNSVQKWEKGTHYPGRKLGKLEAALGITLDDGSAEPDILPEGLREEISEGASTPERAAYIVTLVEAAMEGRPLPIRKRRAAR